MNAVLPPLRRDDTESGSNLVLWILRAGLAACYIGHGNLGFLHLPGWVPYFGVVGIGSETAATLMPWVGAFDVLMGLSVLFFPMRSAILYMTAWCVWTALLRPLSGEPVWEFIERAGNYGVPLALFLMTRGGSLKAWFRDDFRHELTPARLRCVSWTLRLTTVFLLAGHGALQTVAPKEMFSAQYSFLGLPGSTVEPFVGSFECLLAVAVLIYPDRRVLFAVLAWKLATELLCPMCGGTPVWVFIEHGGSYAAPLALAFLHRFSRQSTALFRPAPAA